MDTLQAVWGSVDIQKGKCFLKHTYVFLSQVDTLQAARGSAGIQKYVFFLETKACFRNLLKGVLQKGVHLFQKWNLYPRYGSDVCLYMPNAYPTTPKWLMTSDLSADVDTVLSRPQVWPILAFGSCISSNSLQKVRLWSPLWSVHNGQGHAVLTAGCTLLWMKFDLDCMPWLSWCTMLCAAVLK